MAADRRIPPRSAGVADEADYAPRSAPRLPAAFVGRRRFTARREPELVEDPDDPIARARAWGEQDFDLIGEEPVAPVAPVPDEDDDPGWAPEEPEPRSSASAGLLGSSGYVIDDGGDHGPDPEINRNDLLWKRRGRVLVEASGLPRLRVAGAPAAAVGPELPPPPPEDWPSETPPHGTPLVHQTDHAHGAENSFGAVFPQAEPPPADPRPRVAEVGRFPLPGRPEGPGRSSLTLQPVPSPFRSSVPPELAETADPIPQSLIPEDDLEPISSAEGLPRLPVAQSVAPLDYGLPADLAPTAVWTQAPPSLGPSTTTLAALGCLVAFVVLLTLGAVGITIFVAVG